MAQRSTAYYGPSAATAALVEAIVRDTHATLPVSVVCQGEYGVHGSAHRRASPGSAAAGREKILEVKISRAGERQAFRRRRPTELRAAASR